MACGPAQADRLSRRPERCASGEQAASAGLTARISPRKNAKRMLDQPAQLGEKSRANGTVDDAVIA